MYTIIESQVGGAQFAQFRRLSNADDEERRAVLIAWKQQAKVRGWSARLSVPSRGVTVGQAEPAGALSGREPPTLGLAKPRE